MKALSLIIQREYLSRIKKKSFILMTILTPIMMIALIFVPLLLAGIKDSEAKRIAIVDNTGKYAQYLQSSDEYQFETASENPSDLRPNIGNELFGILQITDDLVNNPKAITFYSEKQAPQNLLTYIDMTFSEVIQSDKLNQLAVRDNIDPQAITEIQQILQNSDKVKITTMRWSKDGDEKETSTMIASAIGMVFTFLMYMFIMMYGVMVMNGVVEEKSNRIVEVMISSVRPFDLMMGKVIGIGLVGLTQLFIWIALVGGMLVAKNSLFPMMEATSTESMAINLNLIASVNWIELIASFLILFIGGYLLYASLFAMIGAAVDNAQDTQQFMMPISLIFIFAIYAGVYSIQNPDGPLAFWCSLIPLTSPIVMIVRVPFGIPFWELALSIGLLYLTIIFIIKFAAKIYRIGILMYGKKPNIKEIIKWFNYK